MLRSHASRYDSGWASLAEAHSCSLQCLRRTAGGVVHVSTLLIRCPAADAVGPQDDATKQLAECAKVRAAMLLSPAGGRVRASDSNREGEVCDWSQAPDVSAARGRSWQALTVGAMYFAYRSLRPMGLAHALRVN